MEKILLDIYQRLTSRTFIVLSITIYLLVTNHITTEQFYAINGVSFGGTSIKDFVAKAAVMMTNKTGETK